MRCTSHMVIYFWIVDPPRIGYCVYTENKAKTIKLCTPYLLPKKRSITIKVARIQFISREEPSQGESIRLPIFKDFNQSHLSIFDTHGWQEKAYKRSVETHLSVY